jgi:hypothetical protein
LTVAMAALGLLAALVAAITGYDRLTASRLA